MENAKKQDLLIKSRETLICDAITDVEEFSQEFVIINTDYGKLTVEGEELRIKELNEKEGKITVNGKIIGILFQNENERSKVFKRKK